MSKYEIWIHCPSWRKLPERNKEKHERKMKKKVSNFLFSHFLWLLLWFIQSFCNIWRMETRGFLSSRKINHEEPCLMFCNLQCFDYPLLKLIYISKNFQQSFKTILEYNLYKTYLKSLSSKVPIFICSFSEDVIGSKDASNHLFKLCSKLRETINIRRQTGNIVFGVRRSVLDFNACFCS
jgi:hypothetical protein